MVIFRLGPILIYHYNVILVVGFVLSLFVVYRSARKRDYNEGKVLDWVVWGTASSMFLLWGIRKILSCVGYQSLITRFPLLRGFASLDLSLEAGILVFVIFTILLFRCWRWRCFPPLDFAALGLSFILVISGTVFSVPNVLTGFLYQIFSLPLALANFFYYSAIFYTLSLVYNRYYKEGRVFGWLLVYSLRPVLVLVGVAVLSVVEWGSLLRVCKQMKDHLKASTHLEEEEGQLENRLKELENTDPSTRPERVQENAPEEDADEAEAGARFAALKGVFVRRLRDVRAALRKVRGGSYGLCDRCGEKIDPARIKAKPDARYCLKCAKDLEEAGRS
ncbi:TraR/DksA C4-type zinc finger protein [Patescibacteria group bacterium]|nr:TraR/DksA C4-type zinc finger protein [Patescibacteria group bacterium]